MNKQHEKYFTGGLLMNPPAVARKGGESHTQPEANLGDIMHQASGFPHHLALQAAGGTKRGARGSSQRNWVGEGRLRTNTTILTGSLRMDGKQKMQTTWEMYT